MKNKMEDLRNHLFATIEDLRDKEDPMDIDRAKTVAEVAGKLIDSAKVEVELVKHVGGTGSRFFAQGRVLEDQSGRDN